MKIRTLIVDDEPVARRVVKKFLKNEPEFELIGESGDGEDTVRQILALQPDLVFLDIQMPEMDGFEVIKALGAEKLPRIIFVTAYDEFAIKAFEVNAVDYLLKPFDIERFQNAVDRVKELLLSNEKEDGNVKALVKDIYREKKYLERLLLKTEGRIIFLKTAEIEWIEAAAYYVNIHIKKESYLYRETLHNLESKLDPAQFVRIHRSFIVNIDNIKELQPWQKNRYLVILQNGKELALSRNYKNRLFEVFSSPME